MKTQTLNVKIITSVICFILLVCTVLFTITPHMHNCSGTECSVCDLTKAVREVFLSLCTLSFLAFVFTLSVIPTPWAVRIPLAKEATLVGRKVKLSD